MITKRILLLYLLFAVVIGTLSAQQIETSHIRFLKRLAAGIEHGELEGKNIRQYMLEERIAIVEGNLSMLKSLLSDSTALTEIAIVDGKRCAASFYKDGLRVFSITYPADYQLILGVTLIEAENYLFEAVNNTPMLAVDTISVSRDFLTQKGNSIIYVKTGSSYIIPELNSNRYYVAVEKNNIIDNDTLSSLLLKGNIELDSISVKEVGDSVDVEDSHPPLHENNRECWLLSFIRGILGCKKYDLLEKEKLLDSVPMADYEKTDRIFGINEKEALSSITVDGLEDSMNHKKSGLLFFIKRIFGWRKSHIHEADSICETIQMHLQEKKESDSLLYENQAILADSLMISEDSLVFELLYSEDMPVESMANLVTGTDIVDSISIDILLVKYGYRTEKFTVPLRQWITFCLTEGCQPYFGVISQDSSEVVCELIMHNELFGYAHVMKLTFNPIIIAQRKGIVKARLNSYVPIDNLKRLFDEDE